LSKELLALWKLNRKVGGKGDGVNSIDLGVATSF
jgi:hypothetical protein